MMKAGKSHSCVKCGNRISLKTVPSGRLPKYCSVPCRRQAEYAERHKKRSFTGLQFTFMQEGESAVRQRLADDPDFAEQLIVLAETWLADPDGRERAELDAETLALLLGGGFHVYSQGHDTPLPSDADIDYAAETGDWSRMIRAAYESMTWQLANGYIPDLALGARI
jgi:hypothetical protein